MLTKSKQIRLTPTKKSNFNYHHHHGETLDNFEDYHQNDHFDLHNQNMI